MNGEQSRSNQPETLVSKEDWSSWLEHPMTKIFRELLRKRMGIRKDDWVAGCFTTLEMNAKALGEVQVLQAILELSAEEVNEGMSDE